jgi:spore coat protein CotH
MRASISKSALILAGVVLMAGCDNPTATPRPLTVPVHNDIVAASTESWPGLFDPFTVLSLNIVMSGADWDKIRRDATNTIEVPAQFHADGEAPIAVTVRRKSSRALPSESNPIKIGMKVKTVSGNWHGVTTLSLENGADAGPIAEGLAWNLHELASIDGFYGADYHPALASWVRVYLNGSYIGIYVNVEQRNKQFLRNRFGTTSGKWLYEVDEQNVWELEAGDPHSPTWTALCYAPFNQSTYSGKRAVGGCAMPSDAQLEGLLNQYIEMQAMLTQGAIDAFTDNPDALFSHSKNYSFVDFADGSKRRYYPWDLDAVFRSTSAGIYGTVSAKNKLTQQPFQLTILNHPAFRQQYNSLMLGLTDPAGPLGEAKLHGFINSVQTAVQPALESDPYLVTAFRSGEFTRLKNWISARIPNVRAQVIANKPAPR